MIWCHNNFSKKGHNHPKRFHMDNSIKAKVTYKLDSCHNPTAPFRSRDWQTEYEFLSETDMRSLAKAFGFNKKSVEKLVSGPKKFRYIKKKGYEMLKVIHDEPVDCWSASDKRQPGNILAKELIARFAQTASTIKNV